MKKKIIAAVLAAFLSLCAVNADAATREEVAAINVQTADDFQFWNEDSLAKYLIVEFVEDVTDPDSPNYIPPEDRIATFDMDGTFYCETAPIYFQEAMFLYRVLEDEDYKAPKKLSELAKKIQPKVYNKEKLTPAESKAYFNGLTEAYKGMTRDEYRAYVRKFMQTNEAGFTNLKRGEAFYLPMVEVISYLTNNDFVVYIDTGCGVDTTRELVNGVIPIQFDRIIGSDFNYSTTNMGKENPHDHFYDRDKDQVIISGKPLHDNGKTLKVFAILNQIGKQPVLAFGNSSGDTSMFEFTLQNNKYRSAAFYVLCDDVERELGNPARAENEKIFAQKRGYNTISMRKEFKTIYGDNVKISK